MNIKTFTILLFFFFILAGCRQQINDFKAGMVAKPGRVQFAEIFGCNAPVCYYDAIMCRHKLTDVEKFIPGIRVELKYASTDNFMQTNLYCCLRKAYLQPAVAQMLAISQQYLSELHPGYSLVVYDAARPLQVQQMMWDHLQLPVHEKTKFLSNPKYGSIHNFGAAVDVSVVRSDGTAIDMGTDYDHIEEEAYPKLEQRMLIEGKLTHEHIENRQLLRDVMRKGGFWGIQTEWWHFNAMTRDEARQRFQIIK